MKHSLILLISTAVLIGMISVPATASSDLVENWSNATLCTESGWTIHVSTTDHVKKISSFRVLLKGQEIKIPQEIFEPVSYPLLDRIKVMQSNLDGSFYVLVPGLIFDANGNGTKAHLLSLFFDGSSFARSTLETVPAEYVDGL